MKTLCSSLVLLLLIACCCDAMPNAVRLSTEPGICCFKFYTKSLPSKLVSTITKTHSSCPEKAFIVKTIRGRQICFSQSFPWALDIYDQLHNTEGSGLQP